MPPTQLPENGNPLVFLDISLASIPLGRVLIQLYAHVCPLTCENFRQFCTGESKSPSTHLPQGYKGSKFHRIIPGFMLQGGDFVNGDGSGSTTIWGNTKFDDEVTAKDVEEGRGARHDEPGMLNLYLLAPPQNAGPNTNGSQFFITVAPTPFLDGKHVVFGKVVDGMDVVKKVEAVKTGRRGKDVPDIDVVIAQCGEM
ncbi:hypothetical protein MKZ38_008897 [Zalerion maritima]|uniref:Peptidyl-prolyl cis-trans isomerase n=1 Tax=Zalerion maritima TaxID=339359 RepID=A0AAD5RUQ7_9PEZI|nr:hypothetical protein MKZ38_008897 [Zalerion maritima]